MRFFYAFKVLFLVMFSSERAQQVHQALDEPTPPVALPSTTATAPKAPAEKPAIEKKAAEKPPAKPTRSEALTMLAAMQREARFVDLVQEPLDGYTDAQVGAAARDVLRDCYKVMQRMFELQPVSSESEGNEIDVPAGFDPGRIRLTGNVTGEPPFRGRLMHHGWQARHVQLPEWSGSAAAATVVAPAEVELK